MEQVGSMTQRDPRVDPRPGDELFKDGKERVVVGRRERCGAAWFDIYYDGADRRYRCTDYTWRKWAKDAEVLHVAE